MSIEKVRDYFRQWKMDDRVLEFPESSATVELAAKAVDCEPARIAKSLSFQVNENCILLVTAGDSRIDNGKYKSCFGIKAKMLSADKVKDFTGFEVGGVCPLGIPAGTAVYLDISLKRFNSVYPACGSSNSAIELTLEELEQHSHATDWIDVCRGWT